MEHSTSKVLAFVAMAALARSGMADMGQADFVAYNAAGCDNNLYYQDIGVAPGYPSCSVVHLFDDVNYDKNADTGNIDIWWGIPAPDDGCKYFIREPHQSVDEPGCGTVVEITDKAGCFHVPVTVPFELNWCCGDDDCDKVLSPSTKRAVGSSSTNNHALDVSAVKRTNPFSARLDKRADCQWIPSGPDTFTIDGISQKVTAELACPQDAGPAGCSLMQSFSVSSAVTNTFGVSEETTIKSLFDIVEQSVSFSYMHADTQTHSVMLSYSVPIAAGRTGYLTWIPTLECDDGMFSGSECQGVQTLLDGNFCVPKVSNNDPNQPQGIYQVVLED